MLAAVFATKPGDPTLCQPGVDGDSTSTVLPDGTADRAGAPSSRRALRRPPA